MSRVKTPFSTTFDVLLNSASPREFKEVICYDPASLAVIIRTVRTEKSGTSISDELAVLVTDNRGYSVPVSYPLPAYLFDGAGGPHDDEGAAFTGEVYRALMGLDRLSIAAGWRNGDLVALPRRKAPAGATVTSAEGVATVARIGGAWFGKGQDKRLVNAPHLLIAEEFRTDGIGFLYAQRPWADFGDQRVPLVEGDAEWFRIVHPGLPARVEFDPTDDIEFGSTRH